MTSTSRSLRFFWALGIILLLGTVVGAGWFFNQPATGTGPASATEPPGQFIVGSGFVDLEEGITKLHPPQPGRVEAVYVREGDTVSEGALLLSLDATVAKLKLREAEADLAAAKQELADVQAKVKREKTQLKHEIAILQKKIEAAKADVDSVKQERDLYKKIQGVPAEQLAIYENKVESAVKGLEVLDATLAKLRDLEVVGPTELLQTKIQAKQLQVSLAHRAVIECDLYAPSDGVVLRVFAQPSEMLTGQSRQPAVEFCPSHPRIVRAEILQEFAGHIRKGQLAEIVDDTSKGTLWKGKVSRVSDWFAHRRSIVLEPFQFNDVRTLECIVQLDAGSPPVRIGQRVNVKIKQ